MDIATLAGGRAVIDESELESLRAMLGGRLFRPGDPGYEEARVVFNGMFDRRRPGLIVRCRGAADVIEAVRFARRRELLTAVRGGGHSVAGASTCDDGLVIDLSEMNSVVVDRGRRIARVAGGATWGDVDRETQAFGLATPGGIVSHTGVAGLTLSGGMGWLRNKYGLSCDNVVAVDLVTADGDLLTARAGENPDLFWALRGGGGSFGVVTSFDFVLHPVGPQVAAVFSMYPLADARDVMRRWRDWLESAPDAATTEIAAWTAPAADSLPPTVHDRDVVIAAGVYAGDPDEGLRVLAPLRSFAQPIGEIAGLLPFNAVQRAFDPFFPNTGAVIAHWKSQYLDALTDAAIDVVADRAEHRSAPSTMVFVMHLGGAVQRAPADQSPLARRARFVANFMGNWSDPRDTPEHVAWVRDAWDRLAPHSTGAVYLNFLGQEPDADGLVRATFGPSYDRLVGIKKKYDPTNFFQLNPNVRPLNRSSSAAVSSSPGSRPAGR
jgi:FAD/FMN-containing dehydrogenase